MVLRRPTLIGMTKLIKGTVTITLDVWLRAQHPHSAVTPQRYLELYRAELQREGWTIVAPSAQAA